MKSKLSFKNVHVLVRCPPKNVIVSWPHKNSKRRKEGGVFMKCLFKMHSKGLFFNPNFLGKG